MENRFRTKRHQIQKTQVSVAQELDISQTTVSMWETGGSLPRAELLPKLAALYGCTVDELLCGDAREENKEAVQS